MGRRYSYLTDEHIPDAAVDALRRAGWSVDRVVDVLGQSTTDPVVFAHAASHGLVWITSDERALVNPRRYQQSDRAFIGMIVWTQKNRRRMTVGSFVAKVRQLEEQADPFPDGVHFIRPD